MPNNSPESFDTNSQTSKEQDRRMGAKLLSQANFGNRHSIVESSFDKARRRGEKLSGKPGERRHRAFLSRLEDLIDEHGNKMERLLWRASIKDELLVQEDNITEATWDFVRQQLRDNGLGGIELTEELKHEYCEEWRAIQRESLEKWASYLGDEHSPFPIWFKVYAWDGMTKMGVYNKAQRGYESRNETTIAPYPEPDAEVLSGVFEIINRYHGNGEREFYTEEGKRNIKLEQIVQSGNFARIYNAVQQDIAPIVEPPENPEDVHGEWIEYQLGDESDIARAAMGTGWCVASSSTARSYLEYGTYGHGDNNWSDNGSEAKTELPKTRFILLHLKDSSTGKLSKNAVASVRLGLDGTVAEISGLEDGQALTDSLVPAVEEKVKSLPGGEKYLKAFADKRRLIYLDHKMQADEDIAVEDIRFIWELDRLIEQLDTYRNIDPRVSELRKKYDVKYALEREIEPEDIIWAISPDSIAQNLDTLLSHGADINDLVSRMDPRDIVQNLDTLISHGADVNDLVSRMDPHYIAGHLDTLLSHDADIDDLALRMPLYDIIYYLDTLISHGANININDLVSRMDPRDIPYFLDTILSHGADINDLASGMDPHDIVQNLDTLISHDADINILVSRMAPYDIVQNLDTLISHDADIDTLVSKLEPGDIAKNRYLLRRYGANV